jgi:hypothetical protein
MLSLKDCLDMSEVSDAELGVISRHEHVPPIVALELGQELIQSPAGLDRLRRFIVDEIARARRRGRCRDCERFCEVLGDHDEKYPQTRESSSGLDEPLDEPLCEILAIGRVRALRDLRDIAPGSQEPWSRALRQLRMAQWRHDCAACQGLSLALLRRSETSGEAAGAARR